MSLDAQTGEIEVKGENDYDDSGDEDDDDDDDDEDDYNISTVYLNDGSSISVRTSILEDQAASVHTTLFLCESLQQHMYPYVEAISGALARIITSSIHDDLLSYAVTTCSELVRCVSRSQQRQGTRAILDLFLKSAISILHSSVMDGAGDEGDCETVVCAVKGIDNALRYAAYDFSKIPKTDFETDVTELDLQLAADAVLLLEPQVDSLVGILMQVFDNTLRIMALRVADAKCNSAVGDYDEQAANADKAADQNNEELLEILCSLFSTMMQLHASTFLSLPSVVKELVPATFEYLKPHFSALYRRFSIHVLCELLKHCIFVSSNVNLQQSFLKESSPLLKECLDPSDAFICRIATEACKVLSFHGPNLLDDELKHKLLLLSNQQTTPSIEESQRNAKVTLERCGLRSL